MMKTFAISLVFLEISIHLASSLSLFGDCPNVPTVENFDVKKYAGKWYEIQRGPRITTYFEEGLKCVQAEYTYIDDKNIQVNNGGIRLATGQFYNKTGNAQIPNSNEPAKLRVTFPIFYNLFKSTGNYWVLDTDYNTYSVVYSCSKLLGFIKTEAIWILSRQRQLNPQITEAIVGKLKSVNANIVSNLIVQDQKDCPEN